jgi:ubiquinone/menaquinone biosynthesis C-methylase UbiE
MLEIANKYNFIKTMKGSSEMIPLKDNSIDLVVCRFSLTYWTYPNKGFKEIHRILKPEGKIIIEALNRDFSRFKLFLIKLHMIYNSSGFNIAQYHSEAYKTAYSRKTVSNYITNAGFNLIYSEGNDQDWKYILIGIK